MLHHHPSNLGFDLSPRDMHYLGLALDMNGDGRISYFEFVNFVASAIDPYDPHGPPTMGPMSNREFDLELRLNELVRHHGPTTVRHQQVPVMGLRPRWS